MTENATTKTSGGSETDRLLPNNHQRRRSRSKSIEEYTSIALAVVENTTTHEPIVLHDLGGPILSKEPELLQERNNSIVTLARNASTVDEVHVGSELQPPGGEATIASTIASMSKNLIGCGTLSLANGIANSANAPSAIWAGNFWILVLGAIFGYFCWLIGKICQITDRHTYRGIWQETVGYRGSVAVSIFNGLKAALTNLAYATILADT
eukprot:scaffold9430_cov115-Cylindrotheca_fusiformis.AAC.1